MKPANQKPSKRWGGGFNRFWAVAFFVSVWPVFFIAVWLAYFITESHHASSPVVVARAFYQTPIYKPELSDADNLDALLAELINNAEASNE